MGWFDDIFGQKKTQESQQTGTSNTTTSNNAWDQIKPFFSQFLQQYSAPNIANAQVAPNALTTAAGSNQLGTTANLTPGYQAASGVAASGITPSSIQSFMNPYTDAVVNATQNDFNTQNARANAGVQAQAAKMGALTGTQGAVAKNLAMESQRRQQDPIIANLRSQGYGQAANTAAQSAGLQLQGAGALGSLTNAQTGANAGLSGIGQQQTANQWQNVLTPFQLNTQASSSLPNFYQGAGNTSNTTSTGSSTGSSTATDSPFNIGTDLIAGGLKLFSDERMKHDIHPVGKTFDGQPIYTFKYNGSPQTHMGLMAQDVEEREPGAVEIEPYSGMKMVDYDKATKGAKRADGGSVGGIQPFHGSGDSFHDKVEKAFHVFNRMKSYAKGGSIEPFRGEKHYDAGGIVPYGDWNSQSPIGTESSPVAATDPDWTATVEPYKGPSMGDTFMDWHKGRQDSRNKAMSAPDTSLSDQQRSLSAMLSGMQRPAMADGGTPSGYAPSGDFIPDNGPIGVPYSQLPRRRPIDAMYPETPDEPPMRRAPAPEKSWWSGVTDYLGRKTGESGLSNAERIAMTISGMGGGKVAGQMMKEMEADREAGRLVGRFNGMDTMDARRLAQEAAIATGRLPDGRQTLAGIKSPYEIAHMKVQIDQLAAANPAAKVYLMQKIERGEEITPEDIKKFGGNYMPPEEPSPSRSPSVRAPERDATPRERPPPTRVAGGPESRDTTKPPGSELNPAYAPTPAAIAEMRDGTFYTTPERLWPPMQKGAENRKFPSAVVPQGGDPTARATRPNATPASTINRPYQTEEDRKLMYMHMIDPTLRASLEKTPGFQGRVEEEKLRAKRRIETEEKQTQGQELTRQMKELKDYMIEAGPDVVNYATGPYLSDPAWQKRLALIPFANGPGSVLERAQVLNTKVQHTIDAIATQYGALSGGGKGTTDAAREEIKRAVGEAFKARGPAGVFEVLADAQRNIQGLAHLPIDPIKKDYYPEEWRKQPEKPGAPRGAVENTPPPTPNAVASGLTAKELAALPDGPVPGGQYIKRGVKLFPVQGDLGSETNPYPNSYNALAGQYFYDKGKLYKRKSMFSWGDPIED